MISKEVIHFPYHPDFVIEANKLLKHYGFNPHDFIKPYEENGVLLTQFLIAGPQKMCIYLYEQNPNYKFEFSKPAPTYQKKILSKNSLLYLTSPTKSGVNSDYAVLELGEGEVFEKELLKIFEEWLNDLVYWNNKLVELKDSELPEPEVINLNNDVKFTDKEIKLLENHFYQSISNAKESAKLLSPERQKEIELILPEAEQVLQDALNDAKSGRETKQSWYKKYVKRGARFLIDYAIGKGLDTVISSMFGSASSILIVSDINIDFNVLLPSQYHHIISEIEKYLQYFGNGLLPQ